jgi:hypothetical protein
MDMKIRLFEEYNPELWHIVNYTDNRDYLISMPEKEKKVLKDIFKKYGFEVMTHNTSNPVTDKNVSYVYCITKSNRKRKSDQYSDSIQVAILKADDEWYVTSVCYDSSISTNYKCDRWDGLMAWIDSLNLNEIERVN